jgi:hypothetical protein
MKGMILQVGPQWQLLRGGFREFEKMAFTPFTESLIKTLQSAPGGLTDVQVDDSKRQLVQLRERSSSAYWKVVDELIVLTLLLDSGGKPVQANALARLTRRLAPDLDERVHQVLRDGQILLLEKYARFAQFAADDCEPLKSDAPLFTAHAIRPAIPV